MIGLHINGKHNTHRTAALFLVLLLCLSFLGGCQGKPDASGSLPADSRSAVSKLTGEQESRLESAPTSSKEESPAGSSATSAQTSSAKPAVSSAGAASSKPASVSSGAASSSPAGGKMTVNNVYDIKNAAGKLAVWFFEMPSSEEHTGDSMLIRTPSGKTVLVDSGTDGGAQQVLTCLNSLGIKTLDYIIATHMHIDHIGGFPRIIRALTVGACYGTTYTSYATSATTNFLRALQDKGIPYTRATTGTVIHLESNVTIEILYPAGDFPANHPTDNVGLNNTSVVFLLTYGSTRFLFTGDIMYEVETMLTETMPDKLKCDVIKIPHHGSTGSSLAGFLRKTGAKYGVTCTATFNDRAVFDRYKSLGIDPMYTSLVGTVFMVSDGTGIRYAQQKK